MLDAPRARPRTRPPGRPQPALPAVRAAILFVCVKVWGCCGMGCAQVNKKGCVCVCADGATSFGKERDGSDSGER